MDPHTEYRSCGDSAPSYGVRKGSVGVSYGGNAWQTLCAFAGGVSVLSASSLPLLVCYKMTMDITAVESSFTWKL